MNLFLSITEILFPLNPKYETMIHVLSIATAIMYELSIAMAIMYELFIATAVPSGKAGSVGLG